MKAKLSPWGNSQGIRLPSSITDHLNVKPGDELNFKVTENGVELLKKSSSEQTVKELAKEIIESRMAKSKPVSIASDPYTEGNVNYIVISVDPCKPIIREVAKGTAYAYLTLVDAKEAARDIIQNTINSAKKSLTDLRQVGVEKINFIQM